MQRVQRFVGGGSLGSVFGFELLGQAAGAVFAGAATLAGFGLAFGCYFLKLPLSILFG